MGGSADPLFMYMNMVAPESLLLSSYPCGSLCFTKHNGWKTTDINVKAQAAEDVLQDQPVVTQN